MIKHMNETKVAKVVGIIVAIIGGVLFLFAVGAVEREEPIFRNFVFWGCLLGFIICMGILFVIDKPSRLTRYPIAFTVCMLAFLYDKTSYDSENASICYDLFLEEDECYSDLFLDICQEWTNYCKDGRGWFI